MYTAYPGGTLLYSGTAAADGSFSIAIGDDDPQSYVMFVTAEKPNKTESDFIVVSY
jgi:hypothetical protein